MSDSAPPSETERTGDDLLDLWFTLARFDWTCLAMVPADPGGAVGDIARRLADAGQRVTGHPVSAVTLEIVDPTSVRSLVDLATRCRQGRLATSRPAATNNLEKLLVAHPEPRRTEADGPSERESNHRPPRSDVPGEEPVIDESRIFSGQLIIAIPSVLSQPLGTAVARAADGVVLAVELGKTRLADATRTTDLIGREHLVGTCVIVESTRGSGAE